MTFDAQRAVVATGDGIVARFPGILCVARGADPEPLRRLLELCAGVAGPAPGRALARGLATWMSGPDAPGDDVRFGTLSAAGDRLAVFLVGAVDAWVDGPDGTVLSGAHAAIGTDRLLPRPAEPVVLSMGDVRLPPDDADVHDLQAGVVAGAGVVLHPARPADEPAPGVLAGASETEPHDWFAAADARSAEAAAAGDDRQDAIVGGGWGSTDRPSHHNGAVPQDSGGSATAGDRAHRAGCNGTATAHAELDPDYWVGSGGGGEPSGADGSRSGRAADPAESGSGRVGTRRDLRDRPDGRAGDDRAADDQAGDERAAADGVPVDRAAVDRAAVDWAAVDWAAVDRAAADGPAGRGAADLAGGDRADGDRADVFRTDGDRAGDDQAGRGRAEDAWAADGGWADPAPDATGWMDADRAGAGNGSSNGHGRTGAGPDGAGPDGAGPDGAGPDGADPDGADPDGAGPDGADPDGADPDGADPERGQDDADRTPPAGDRPQLPPASSGDEAQGDVAGRHAIAEADGRAGADGSTGPVDRADPAADPAWPDAPTGSGAGLFDEGPAVAGSNGAAPHPVGSAPSDAALDEPTSARQPSPVPREDGSVGSGDGAPAARGFLCDHGHLNDPRAPYCGQCGAVLDERSSGLVAGERPPLGRLVFDDGAVYPVDNDFLVGRMPEADDRVLSGGLQPIIVEDRTGSVSRVHAEIQIAGWDVMLVDAGSRNGTFVAGPEDSAWSPLPPQRGRRLLPGTRVRLGGRTFVFESPSGVR